jgi:hypothetical protein
MRIEPDWKRVEELVAQRDAAQEALDTEIDSVLTHRRKGDIAKLAAIVGLHPETLSRRAAERGL